MNSRIPLILIVDDEHALRRLIAKWLQIAGFQTAEAENGTQAVELTQRLLPDLLIMDVRLPDMTGFTATEQIRQLPGLRTVPVVCLTGLDMRMDVAHEGGCTDLLLKPVERDALLAVVRRQLALAQ